jgi:predicted TIM-barrel fold metal-dependent hydrolase
VRLKQPPSTYLRKLFFDAIAYQVPTLQALIALVGVERIMFGTDHPFFPPHVANAELDTAEWHSPAAHRPVLHQLGAAAGRAILHGNAARLFGLPQPEAKP